jgi:cytochrome c
MPSLLLSLALAVAFSPAGVRSNGRHTLQALCLALCVASCIVTAAHAQEVDVGERLFRQRCASCHGTQPGQNRIGPHLAQLSGRRAGSVEGARYSPALRDAGLTWDEATLDRFLASPRTAVPGTTMSFSVPTETQRRSLIAFLLRPTP